MTGRQLRTLTTETLADRTYRAVRDAIRSGELGPGEKITERGLAERLSVSPTPVRDAIRRLEREGLLDRVGPRTTIVSALEDTAVQDLAEVEGALRGLVARFAARHASDAQLDRLDGILDEADDLLILIQRRSSQGRSVDDYIGALLDTVQQFNDTVDTCANNPVLVGLVEQTRVFSRAEHRTRLLEHVSAGDLSALDRYTYHRALVRALRDRDAEAAERIVTEDAREGLVGRHPIPEAGSAAGSDGRDPA
ncbi:GntR family transcriptional regulator [Nocardiopsis sp. CC223A]|uniref:GntR family transcriptional regulator n=1 Tax=Nocardiopsis sp. CC223A TaxID=3044051 RepID=UPI00278C42F6|nr:GntR family transcriptional regulator [Nocardiopsis sp. CC223A]